MGADKGENEFQNGSGGYTLRCGEKSAEMIEGEGHRCWPSRKRVRNRLKRNGLNQRTERASERESAG
jgi:hypothetical protein